MTSIYRESNLPLWTGVNRPLTFLESDSNIYVKETRCTALEQHVATLSSGAGIDYFSVTGNQFYVHLTNHEILGPYPLPVVVFNFRQDGTPPGTWLPSTLYNSMDVFQHNGTLYVVNITHTSGLTFDPNATDGSGHKLYSVLFAQPQAAIPLGGTTGQALVKHSNTDLDTIWQTIPLSGLADVSLSALTSGQLLAWNGLKWVNANENLSNLGDVALIAPLATNDVLYWNGIDWQNGHVPFSSISGNLLISQYQYPTNFGLSPSVATQTVDPTTARYFEVSPTVSITFNASSTPDGAEMKFIFNSNGGSQTITFGTSFRSTGTLSLGSVIGKAFTVSFCADGHYFFETARAGPL